MQSSARELFAGLSMAAALAAVLVFAIPEAARAQATQLDLHGEWQGSGTDRNDADERPTAVKCRASNQVSGGNLRLSMSCDGTAGREDISATLQVTDAVVKGTLRRSSPDLPFAVSGSVSGRTAGANTTFDVRALFKTRARVMVALLNASSYQLRVIDPEAGVTLMNVIFRKS